MLPDHLDKPPTEQFR